MDNVKSKIALIELNPFHSEVLYSHVSFLKTVDIEIVLIADQKLDNAIKELNMGVDTVLFDFSSMISYWELRNYIVGDGFDIVILNTVQGNRALKFCMLPFPNRIKFTGILHNTIKLKSSRGQRFMMRRFKHFFTIGKYVILPDGVSDELEYTYFNPCYFPEYDVVELDKSDSVWISIPGNMSLRKRDFGFLLELAKHEKLKHNVKFILLGNINRHDGPELKQKLMEEGIVDRFCLFDDFIPYEEFHGYIKKSDYLLPLVHPGIAKAEPFFSNQVSGTFTLAGAYGVTMLCHSKFGEVKNFEYPAVFYRNVEECVELINLSLKSDKVCTIDFEDDRRRYLKFLGLI